MNKRAVSWFLTESGRTFVYGAACVVSSGAIVANFLPHTLFLENYKDFVHLYRSGLKTKLTPELTTRFEQYLNALNIEKYQKTLVKPFAVYGFDLFSAGSCVSKYGIAVGIPTNFSYKSVEDVKKEDIQVNLKSVDWSSNVGMQLANSLVLSENAQKYCLCREILFSQTYKLYLDCFNPSLTVIATYGAGHYLNHKLQLFQRPPMMRYTLYGILSLFGLGMYFLAKDTTQVHYETEVDKKLADMGQDFIEGGVEFYSKTMQRNIALRELMGKEGERKYSKLGNENFFIRNVRLPLNIRKKYFELRLEELTPKNEDAEGTTSVE